MLLSQPLLRHNSLDEPCNSLWMEHLELPDGKRAANNRSIQVTTPDLRKVQVFRPSNARNYPDMPNVFMILIGVSNSRRPR